MPLKNITEDLFVQIIDALQQLSPAHYTNKSSLLSGASIGQHVRHIIELFQELHKGYETGAVNYEKRQRNYNIEQNKDIAIQAMHLIIDEMGKGNKDLQLISEYDGEEDSNVAVATNYFREIIYNIEHTVHHMALIRVGLQEVSHIVLPATFGVAASTTKYRRLCAQ